MKKGGVFFAADKDIYDLLASSSKKMSKATLLEVLRNRGVYLSEEDDREKIIDYMSRLPHDLYQRQELIDLSKYAPRAQKTTSAEFNLEMHRDEVLDAIDAVKDEREKSFDETYTVTARGENNLYVHLDYSELDFSRTRLRQRREFQAFFEIDINDGKITVRRPFVDRCDDIARKLAEELRARGRPVTDGAIEFSIDLSGITTPSARTHFFTGIIQNMSGFKVEDVPDVKIDRSIEKPTADIDDEDDVADQNDDNQGAEETEAASLVKRAVLSGTGILQSQEYQRFTKSGFYLSRIVWLARDLQGDQNKYEFEASLGDPARGKGFSYAIRGKFTRKNDGGYTKSKRPAAPDEKRRLSRIIEGAAGNSLQNVTEEE